MKQTNQRRSEYISYRAISNIVGVSYQAVRKKHIAYCIDNKIDRDDIRSVPAPDFVELMLYYAYESKDDSVDKVSAKRCVSELSRLGANAYIYEHYGISYEFVTDFFKINTLLA